MNSRSSSVASCSYTPIFATQQQGCVQQRNTSKQQACWSSSASSRHKFAAQRGSHVCHSVPEVLGVLAFSALPFTAVQALADSDFGKSLRENVEKNKPKFEAETAEKQKQQAEARSRSMWYGPERPKYLGPIDAAYPPYLEGEAPADYGFDILKLGSTPQSFERYFELELFHARWAMLSALGILIPEILQYTGISKFSEPRWQYVGYAKLQGEDLNYFGIPGLRIAGNQGIAIIAICQVLLMFGPEFARSKGVGALEPLGIYLPGDINYPGGVFDPFGLADDPESFEDLKVKEMKNGRLAMVAWLGFGAQAAVTGKGPVQNLLDVLPNQ